MIKDTNIPNLTQDIELQYPSFELPKELDLISILHNESDQGSFFTSKNLKKQEKSISEISAWEDEFSCLSPITKKLVKNARKRPCFPPSIKSKYLSPVLTRKTSKAPVKFTDWTESFSSGLSKLPFLPKTKSPIYRHIMPEEKPLKKAMLTRKKILTLRDTAITVFKFTPSSINNIKNAIQITPIFNRNILRSCTSTKKQTPYD
ncbi:hypothetical protein SteCoe_25465 [Stentor coeruleus]|uniref:Uncharacterized protein n=1 Tax=Stentor coeruleus TaxID=5963 RepID=A0A1R2BCK7_9CILI|nr:hypothetical protein SteCoe_26554 [Stentor coeruleus]OMJ75388.1 hypothetical protein SteCoe_25465 [Stentor coeruleus]